MRSKRLEENSRQLAGHPAAGAILAGGRTTMAVSTVRRIVLHSQALFATDVFRLSDTGSACSCKGARVHLKSLSMRRVSGSLHESRCMRRQQAYSASVNICDPARPGSDRTQPRSSVLCPASSTRTWSVPQQSHADRHGCFR